MVCISGPGDVAVSYTVIVNTMAKGKLSVPTCLSEAAEGPECTGTRKAKSEAGESRLGMRLANNYGELRMFGKLARQQV